MRIGVMCSGSGTNFENIVTRCYNHEVVVMIHNIKNCGAVERAKRLNVPYFN
jgi:phosphoribosylglycinamide formyltransferase-1